MCWESSSNKILIYFLQKHILNTVPKTVLMRHLYSRFSSMRILISWSSSLLHVQKPTAQTVSALFCLQCVFRELQICFKLELEVVCIYFRPFSRWFIHHIYSLKNSIFCLKQRRGQEATRKILSEYLNPYPLHYSLLGLVPQLKNAETKNT